MGKYYGNLRITHSKSLLNISENIILKPVEENFHKKQNPVIADSLPGTVITINHETRIAFTGYDLSPEIISFTLAPDTVKKKPKTFEKRKPLQRTVSQKYKTRLLSAGILFILAMALVVITYVALKNSGGFETLFFLIMFAVAIVLFIIFLFVFLSAWDQWGAFKKWVKKKGETF
jgi:VIT1/CCC1 family predicted Fe2+/Mn2+ transporter